ncbi:hypothetical protein A3D77_05155 [Candidatus Gottesmanbacteria bacterium RIFCSPHIGHO2_02_FULL_39_11]|uniref:Uncharacterized protein n=1 Tax=Candidatus Gottesmanbacteria bacterium RIFCSPHIGHO2_02_FULL_39_11 TaxID=1798382 RepID=A0A1F5ZP74_9BACT|nr:MAG: hypothetical protein A3D77_05155 [Candidatus Gottesmanbacteria bacterium RIFCSPHIGHO2_02_FULL_39_11]
MGKMPFLAIFKNPKILFGLIVIVILIIIALIVFLSGRNKKTDNNMNPVIAKVGSESIYQSDLDTEIGYFPSTSMSEEKKKTYLLDKIIQDSILLQESTLSANLPSTIFDSSNKDYMRRVELVQEIKQQKEETISSSGMIKRGFIVSVWANNFTPTPFNLEQNKTYALDLITKLHNRVKRGEITMQQAGDEIRNDKTVQRMDFFYYYNSFGPFNLNSEHDGTVNAPELNKNLWSLEKGGVSDVVHITALPQEEYYAFGLVTDVIPTDTGLSYEDWYQNAKSRYQVITTPNP